MAKKAEVDDGVKALEKALARLQDLVDSGGATQTDLYALDAAVAKLNELRASLVKAKKK